MTIRQELIEKLRSKTESGQADWDLGSSFVQNNKKLAYAFWLEEDGCTFELTREYLSLRWPSVDEPQILVDSEAFDKETVALRSLFNLVSAQHGLPRSLPSLQEAFVYAFDCLEAN